MTLEYPKNGMSLGLKGQKSRLGLGLTTITSAQQQYGVGSPQ